MRLFLHGRSTPAMLHSQLEHAKRSHAITTVRLSCWDLDEMDDDVLDALTLYLETLPPHQVEDVTIQNCTGDQHRLVAAIVRCSPKSLTIRYDKQQTELPTSIATGIGQAAESGSRLQALQLRGVTLTPPVVESFRMSLPKLEELMTLSIQSNFTLMDLDHKRVSILGRSPEDVDDVFYEMIRLLQELPHLTTLDLEHCHISDTYLAELLRAARKRSLRTVQLRGNMAQQETMDILSDWMLSRDCALQHLDLSWQRLVGSKANCSPFVTQMPFLAKAILHNKSLKTLRISENRLSDSDVKLLAMALAQNHTLQELEIKDCRITMDGFRWIARQMPLFHLTKLNMNGLQQVEGVKLKSLFFKPLSQNVYLTELVLPQVESKSLAWLLEWNKAGRRVLTARPSLSPCFWPTLLQQADRVGRNASDHQPERHAASAIYYLLREKGHEVVAKNQAKKQDEALSRRRKLQQEQLQWRTHGRMTPPVTPCRGDSTRRISPNSSFEESRCTPTWSPANSIRHISSPSGEVELSLDEMSSFDKTDESRFKAMHNNSNNNNKCNGGDVRPNPNLARPMLMAHRKSSASTTNTSSVDPRKWMLQGKDLLDPAIAPRTTFPQINAQ